MKKAAMEPRQTPAPHRKREKRTVVIPAALIALLFIVIPVTLSSLGSGYLFQLATLSLIFIILATSMNLITGTTGLLCLGQAAFYGVGAYTAALLSTKFGLSFLLTLPLSGLVAGFCGLLVALPTMRLVSIYFAVATLGVGEIIYVTLLNWVSLTRGPMGISGIPPISFFGWEITGQLGSYYVVAAVALLSVYYIYRLTYSYYGNAMRSLREDDQCAAAMGIDVARLKIQVFSISTFFAGIAGALIAHTSGYISPDYFKFGESILILAMVVVGGLGSVPGGIIGALLLILLPEVTRELGDFRNVAVGLVMFLSILLLPKGLLGEVSAVDIARKQLGGAWDGAGVKVGWK